MSDDENRSMNYRPPTNTTVDNNVDQDTIRIMVSTDNHLGYAERDPIRGLDSFAAFEEVLMLSKIHKCDMVLLAGDLFHDNKPSRRTMYKTMEIIRRYCLGPNPVQLEIVSDHSSSNVRGGCINYEDEHMSVDLPIFSIHGNHDDPTRDGGTEMLAALDLLAVTKFVNYFGRQDEVDKVEVAPILIRKGSTRLALYGMGSMRDERLNRMWQGKKVRFLRPDNNHEEDEEEDSPWFNIFALHQNRDLGRGKKNCVHESMIPEWMDLVVWGHEHECLITPSESAVGTFRISQPGSSVATALTAGEARRKHVGILDVRGSQFRMTPLPLTQVRSFAMGELSLQDQERVDPQDPNVESKILDLLSREVKHLIREARENSQHLLEDANASYNQNDHDDDDDDKPNTSISEKLRYKVIDPDQVLIRLRVEHSGFASLNNQRFGSRFVGDVANPSDILLFHKRRAILSKEEKEKKEKILMALEQPIAPVDLAEVNVEDLIEETLEMSEKKLELLDQHQLGLALDDFVVKELGQAIGETVDKLMDHQQTKLITRGIEQEEEENDDDQDDNHPNNKVTTANAVREICLAEAEQARKKYASKLHAREEEEETNQSQQQSRKRKSNRSDSEDSDDDHPTRKQARRNKRNHDISSNDEDEEKTPRNGRRPMTNRRTTSRSTNSRRIASNQDNDSESDEEVRPETSKARTSRPTRRAAAFSARKARYADNDDDDYIEEDDDNDYVTSQNSKKSIVLSSDDDEDIVESKSNAKRNKTSRTVRSTTQSKKTPVSRQRKATNSQSSSLSPVSSSSQTQTQLTSFTSTRKATATTASRRTTNRRIASYYNLDDDSDSDDANANIAPSAAGRNWGTAKGKKT